MTTSIYKGISHTTKYKDKNWIAQTKVHNKNVVIGRFDTEHEAYLAYVKFKETEVRELSPVDRMRLARYQLIHNFCKGEFKSQSEIYTLFPRANCASIRYVVDNLERAGWLELGEGIGRNNKSIKTYRSLKENFTENDLIPSAILRTSTQKNNHLKKVKKVIERPANARVITFEGDDADKSLVEKYRLQRELDRRAFKSPNNFVSGSSLSMF